jgi:HPt (histidine-containing phosphotransfer) domain-containing protein
MSETDMQDKVRQLALGFLARLPARFEKMNEAFALCQAQASDGGHWQELRRLLHSLGGAAGTFGLPDLGQEARAIETIIDRCLLEGGFRQLDIDAVGTALSVLQRAR